MSRLPGVYPFDKETSAIPSMPGERIVCVVGQLSNGPTDRPFAIDRSELSRYLPLSSVSGKPDFMYHAIEQTLKAANYVLAVRVADSVTAKKASGTDGALITVETKYPTSNFNGMKVKFLKGKFEGDVILDFNNKQYALSVDDSADNYIMNAGKFCPDLSIVAYVAPQMLEEEGVTSETPKAISSSITVEALIAANITLSGGNSGYKASPDVEGFKSSISLLEDVDTVDPFIIMAPGVTDITILKALVDVTVARKGDCKVILDTPNTADETEISTHLQTINTQYAEGLAGWGVMYDSFLKRDIQAPPTVGYGKAFLLAQLKSEYGSTAGKNRGCLDVFNDVVVNLNPAQKLKLQDARINPVIMKKGLIMIYNNMTLLRANSVYNDSNVTNVSITLKKAVLATSEDYVFEGNMTDTWNRWVTAVTPILDKVKKNNGVYDYRVLMGEKDGTVTSTDIDTNRMPGIIKFKPTRESKWIDIYFNAYSYGIEFDE